MPTLTRWFLRAAMIHLVAGLALGLAVALPAWAELAGPWRPVHVHLLVMGWATQVIFGVAYWMFPRQAPLDLRVVPWLGWFCFATLNAGLVLRAVAEPVMAGRVSVAAAAAAQAAAACQLAAIVAFVVLMWPRVRAR